MANYKKWVKSVTKAILNVDGTIDRVPNDDGALLGATLPAGEHTVEIVYTTPGGKTGGIITAVSLGLLLIPLALWIFRRRKAALAAAKADIPEEIEE